MTTTELRALWAILFRQRQYELIAGQNCAPHIERFRRDVRNAVWWVSVGSALAISALWLRFGNELFQASNAGKWITFAGIFTGGIATWFALATPEDTWDVSERMDTALRGVFFKVVFFPGLIASVIGTFWLDPR